MKRPPSPAGHVAWLDSVRGLAALTVIGSHYVNGYDLPCQQAVCQQILTYTPLHMAWDGAAAVSLFFVLSGLVLALRYFRHGSHADWRGFSLGAYCIGRICRIWPPYLAVLALSVGLHRHYQTQQWPLTQPPHNDWLPSLWAKPLGWADALHDSFLLGMRLDMAYLPQAWTLSIELALSLLVPVGVLLAERGGAWLLGFSLLAIYPLGITAFWFHFMLGIALAQQHRRCADYLATRKGARRGVLLVGLALYSSGAWLDGWLPAAAFGWLTGVGAALLLVYSFGSLRMQSLLSIAPLRRLGRVSYSVYLLHLAVLMNATPWFLAGLNRAGVDGNAAWWLGGLCSVAATLALAGLFYRGLEVPSMALGHRVRQAWIAWTARARRPGIH